MEQTRRFSQEVRGKKSLHICLYFFQIIRICVLKCLPYSEDLKQEKIIISFYQPIMVARQQKQIKEFSYIFNFEHKLLFSEGCK